MLIAPANKTRLLSAASNLKRYYLYRIEEPGKRNPNNITSQLQCLPEPLWTVLTGTPHSKEKECGLCLCTGSHLVKVGTARWLGQCFTFLLYLFILYR